MTTVAGVVDDVAEFDAENRAISAGGTATGRCKHEWLESMSEIQNVSGRVLVDFVAAADKGRFAGGVGKGHGDARR